MAQAIFVVVISTYAVVLFGINALKGKFGFAFVGIIPSLTFLWWIGAIRLAKPTSWWARRYYVGPNEDKLQRAIARHGQPGPSPFAGPEIVREGWLAGTVPKDQGVPVQRRNPQTGKWVVVYVPREGTHEAQV